MKVKSWVKYLIFTIVIISMTSLWGYIDYMIKSSYYRYELNYVYLIISLLLGISIGLVIGLDRFITEKNKDGIWKINYPKLILIGLPSLYISITDIFIYSSNYFIFTKIAFPLFWLIKFDISHIDIFQIILGYAVITSFYKYSSKKICESAE